MTHKLKITAIGNSAGIILPKDLLARLRVEKGDELSVVETAYGIELSPADAEFDRQMKIAEGIMRKDRDALHILAQ